MVQVRQQAQPVRAHDLKADRRAGSQVEGAHEALGEAVELRVREGDAFDVGPRLVNEHLGVLALLDEAGRERGVGLYDLLERPSHRLGVDA